MKLFGRKSIALAVATVFLLSLSGCRAAGQNDASTDDRIEIGQVQNAGKALPIDAQYIRTDGYVEGAQFPGVCIIRSLPELKNYYADNKGIFDLEHKEQVYPDTTVGFLDACERYGEDYFADYYLLFVLLEEGSGSVRHRVDSVKQTAQGQLAVSIETLAPETGTCDMAQWHIILELSRDVEVEMSNDVQVYLNESLAWNGGVAEPQKLEAPFKKPPIGTLVTQEGEVAVQASGYSWYYEMANGMTNHTIADQAGRPLEQRFMDPVTINSRYAETVYALAPGSGGYEPANCLGYFVKLAWEVMPTAVSFTCWPDTVWQNSSTLEERVISHGDKAFYAWPGGYIYEIVATWEDTGAGYWGTANYYVYILGGEWHEAAEAAQITHNATGCCENAQAVLHINHRYYTVGPGNSEILTDILPNLDYFPDVCNCSPEFTVETGLAGSYGVHLSNSYARCSKGQAELTQEQVDQIRMIVETATKE